MLYKGLRTISVTEAIDTADAATWQMVLMVYGAWHEVLRRHLCR